MDSLADVIEEIRQTRVFALDLECDSVTSDPRDALNPYLARITHVSLASIKTATCLRAIPELKESLIELLSNKANTAIVHSWPYDGCVLDTNSWIKFKDVKATLIDTVILSWLVDEEDDHGLKQQVKKRLGYTMVTYKEVTKTSHTMQMINYCLEQEESLNFVLNNWGKKIPYPTISDPLISKTKLRKQWKDAGDDKKTIKAKTEEVFGDKAKEQFILDANNELTKLKLRLGSLESQRENEFRNYALDDAKKLMQLYGHLLKMAKRRVKLKWIEVEMVDRKISIQMQLEGIRIDQTKLQELKEYLEPLIDEFRADVYNLAKQEFNPASPSQVTDVLFHTLGLDPPVFRICDDGRRVPKLTPAGDLYVRKNNIKMDLDHPETITQEIRDKFLASSNDVLERVNHPIGQAILNFRTAMKLYTTYVIGAKTSLDITKDNRLHTYFNTVGTDTGRFSSSGPNLQNIPSRAKGVEYDSRIQKLGAKLRTLFVPPEPDELAPEGYDLIVADQSQIELRFMTYFTGDPNLVSIYHEHVDFEDFRFYTGDIHHITSSTLNIPRKLAKNVNFGFNYGMGPEKFARQVKLFKAGTQDYDIEKATQYRDGFFQAYPGIKHAMRQLGWAFKGGERQFSTICGRFRHFGKNDTIAGGKILNCRIQGSSADLLKACIYIIDKYVIPKFPGLRFLLQVHDELVLACPKRYSKEAAVAIKYVMEYPWFPIDVPLLASAKICQNWAENSSDKVPDVGYMYAEVNGKGRIFNADNWAEWVTIQEDKTAKIGKKAACAHLSREQKDWCKTIVPDKGPLISSGVRGKRVVTREEDLARRNAS